MRPEGRGQRAEVAGRLTNIPPRHAQAVGCELSLHWDPGGHWNRAGTELTGNKDDAAARSIKFVDVSARSVPGQCQVRGQHF